MYVIPNPEGLKPCRVCGSEEREVSPIPGRNERTPGFHIRCKVCGSTVIGMTSDEARILWNGENANPYYPAEVEPEEEGWYLVKIDDNMLDDLAMIATISYRCSGLRINWGAMRER